LNHVGTGNPGKTVTSTDPDAKIQNSRRSEGTRSQMIITLLNKHDCGIFILDIGSEAFKLAQLHMFLQGSLTSLRDAGIWAQLEPIDIQFLCTDVMALRLLSALAVIVATLIPEDALIDDMSEYNTHSNPDMANGFGFNSRWTDCDSLRQQLEVEMILNGGSVSWEEDSSDSTHCRITFLRAESGNSTEYNDVTCLPLKLIQYTKTMQRYRDRVTFVPATKSSSVTQDLE
jgi:hypothetical protein